MRLRPLPLLLGAGLFGILAWALMGGGPDGSDTGPSLAEETRAQAPGVGTADEAAVAAAEGLVRDALADPRGADASLPSWTTPPDRDRDLHGIVLGPDGERIPGAEVVVKRAWSRDISSLDLEYHARSTVVAETRSSAQGEFRVPLPPLGLYDLDVRAEGLIAPLIRDCRAGEYVEVRLAPGAVLHGTITARDDNAPLSGLAVRLFRLGSTGRTYDTTTSADGRYRFADLAGGEWCLDVIAQVHESPPWTRLTLDPGEEREQSFQLDSGTTLRGRVVEAETRLPIAGAEISDSWTFHRHSVATGADGRFEVRGLQLGADWAELHVRAPGFGRRSFRPRDLATGTELELELLPGVTARGVLLAADGAPAAGAYVALIGERKLGMDWCGATADEHGAFVVKDLSAEAPHFVFARRDGSGALYAAAEGLLAGGVLELGTLRLPPAASLTGTAFAGAGAPHAAVDLHGPDLRASPLALDPAGTPGLYVLRRRERADDLGRFHFADLCAGEYELRIRSAGAPDVVRSVSLQPGQDLILPPEELGGGLAITGRVQDPDGAPLEDARVTLDVHDQPREISVHTDAAGAFRFERVQPGEYGMMVSPGHASAEDAETWMPIDDLRVHSGDVGLVITLQRAAWITGTVESSGSWSAEFCEVLASDATGKRVGGTYAQANGEFRLRVPASASLRLEFFPMKLLPGQTNTEIRSRAVSTPAAVLESVPAGASGLRVIL
jgi:hypothetical protein